MAGVAGLEPVTSAVTGQRSNQLSYTPAMREEENLSEVAPGVNGFIASSETFSYAVPPHRVCLLFGQFALGCVGACFRRPGFAGSYV